MSESKDDKNTMPNQTPAPPDEGGAEGASKGIGPLSIADLESDPEIKFHLAPDPRVAKERFLIWSRLSLNHFEKRVWKLLGDKHNPWFFVPQVEICGYIVDFYSPVHRVALEADGPDHVRTVFEDRKRDLTLLKKKQIKTFRLYPADLMTNTPQSLFKVIDHFVKPESVVTEKMINEDEGGFL